MSRSVAWRRTISDVCSWRQDQASNATIYILRETGPTGFLLKEEGETKKFKVYLGDPHSCTCPDFKKDKDLCKHICWVLLKKFRVPRQNPVTWQLGLVEREINEILRGIAARQGQRPTPNARKIASHAAKQENEECGGIQQREIGEDDVCPICQDELLEKRLPVTYCKFGCGNNVHIKCMKVWAEHQKTQGAETIKCPMCREEFGSISQLQQEMRNSSVRETRAQMMNEHLGTTCKKCYVCPIVGKCYKCTVCADYHLCQACYNTPTHEQHNFQYREKPNQRWRDAPRSGGTLLPDAVVQNLMNRDISEADYDLLLQLDSQTSQQGSDLTEETVHSFPMERVRMNSTLLAPGQQCRVCLRPYQEGQFVRKLLCRHKFHRDCIDNWLLHRSPTCPIDGTVFTNDSVRQIREANRLRQQRQREENTTAQNGQLHRNNIGPDTTLQIPGIGIASLGNSRVLDRHMNGVLEISGIAGGQNIQRNGINTDNNITSSIQQENLGMRTDTDNGVINIVPSLFVANRHSNPAFPSNNRGSGQSNRGRLAQQRGRLRGSGVNRGNTTSSDIALENSGLQYHSVIGSRETVAVSDTNRNSGIRSLQPLANIRHNSNEIHSEEISSPAQQRTGINFANLLMADIQRSISRQSNPSHNDNFEVHSIGGDVPSNISQAKTEIISHEQNAPTSENDANRSSVFNLSINNSSGSSTEHRTAGGNKKGQRAKGMGRTHTAPTTTQDNLDVNGANINGLQNIQIGELLNSNPMVRAPVPPSIPLPRDARDISVGETNNKPPSGGSTKSRPGRIRSRIMNKELYRIRSNSRERAKSAERNGRNQVRDLYVGNDPETSSGFLSEYIVSNGDQSNLSASKRKNEHKPSSDHDRYRWGTTQNLTGSSIVLSGSGLAS